MATKTIRAGATESSGSDVLQAELQISDLYVKYEQQISAYAQRRATSADAHDVVAETFLVAWRRRDDIPAEPQTLPWLYGVSRNVIANQRRSNQSRTRLHDRLVREPADTASPAALIESADAFAEVSSAIRSLPEADAELLRLTAWEGLGPSEIAGTLGIEPTAARQRLFRARQRLSSELDKRAGSKERRRLVQKVAAVVVVAVLAVASFLAFGLNGPSIVEADLIEDKEGQSREAVDPDEEGTGLDRSRVDDALEPESETGAADVEVVEAEALGQPDASIPNGGEVPVDEPSGSSPPAALSLTSEADESVSQGDAASAPARPNVQGPVVAAPQAETTSATEPEATVETTPTPAESNAAPIEAPTENIAAENIDTENIDTDNIESQDAITAGVSQVTTPSPSTDPRNVSVEIPANTVVADEPQTATAPVAPTRTSTAASTVTTTTNAPVVTTTTATAPTSTTATSTTTTTTTQPAVEAAASLPATPAGPFDESQDLFVVQLDFVARDDAHSAVATAAAVDIFEVEPVVVAGTNSPENTLRNRDYGDVMNATYGNGWVDAQGDRSAAVNAVAGEWITTLESGAHVWVAEGGVSDFTAEVLRSVQAQRPELNTADFVHVVHHSGTSIERTLDDDLELIEREADLVRINDGNGANGTADLHQFADGFEGAARSSDFSDGWEAAFDLLPADDLDFSDTVTALYLLGIGTDLVADPQDFQAQFLG